MDKCSRCGSHAINHKLHGRDGKDGDLCDVCYWRKRAEKAKADLQEKLRQQREACVKAYIDWITGKPEAVEYFSPEPAIFNAAIDNNGEEG